MKRIIAYIFLILAVIATMGAIALTSTQHNRRRFVPNLYVERFRLFALCDDLSERNGRQHTQKTPKVGKQSFCVSVCKII